MSGFITPSQLSRLIGLPDCPTLIDVRVPEDVALNPVVIPTARRHSYSEAHTIDLTGDLTGDPAGPVVIICQRGAKWSEGVAALLRLRGIRAERLEGGMVAWSAAGLPVTPIAALPGRLWVTRARPKIDRIACPWLIRRFVDPKARFLFVTPSEVPAVAEKFHATPFDVDGVFWSHRGETCTFDAMLAEFGLQTEALLRLALVVRAADTDRHDLSPQAAGLLAISVGLSRQYRDDLEQLAAGMVLYDALYRWARDGFDEGHDWPAGRL